MSDWLSFFENGVDFIGSLWDSFGGSILATGVSLYGTSQTMEAFQYEADFARAATERNVDILWFNQAIRGTQYKEYARELVGKQRAAAAASGIDPTKGAPLELEADTVFQTARAAAISQQAAVLEEERLRTEGKMVEAAALAKKQAAMVRGGYDLGRIWELF